MTKVDEISMMKVYVVLANAMGGIQYCGVFASKSAAAGHLEKVVTDTNPRVIEFDVLGAQPDLNLVFVAQTYDRSLDVHNFKGVYGNYGSAKHASGPQGQPLTCSL